MKKNLLEPKVHILIERNNQFLFLKRSHTGCYDGHWCLPTGRVEIGECPTDAVRRETLEEVGLTINPSFISLVYAKVPNVLSEIQKDYEDLCFFFYGAAQDAPRNLEPEKHDCLEWFTLDKLPSPLMPVVKMGIESYLEEKTFAEFGYDSSDA